MPKAKSLSSFRRSNSTLSHLNKDDDRCAIIPQHIDQQEQQNDVRLHYYASSLSSSPSSSASYIIGHHLERHHLPQHDPSPALMSQRKVSIDHILASPPPSPMRHDDVTSIFFNSEYAAQNHPHYKRHRPVTSRVQRSSLSKLSRSKLSRSGCLCSLVDQVSAIDEHPSNVNSISGDNISDTNDDNGNGDDHHCIINSSQSLTHNIELTTVTASECDDDNDECTGWGQFVDVIPFEPPTRNRRIDSPGGTSRFGMRYSPYSTVSPSGHDGRRRARRCSSDSVNSDDMYRSKIDWGCNSVNDVKTTFRHSPSTDGISSALYNVQISGMK